MFSFQVLAVFNKSKMTSEVKHANWKKLKTIYRLGIW